MWFNDAVALRLGSPIFNYYVITCSGARDGCLVTKFVEECPLVVQWVII